MSLSFFKVEPILETLDCNGLKPELFIVCSRVRGPGKTFAFSRHLIRTFFADEGKFVLLVRNENELGITAEGILKSMLDHEYPEKKYVITEKYKEGSGFSKIFLEETVEGKINSLNCGYVISISKPNKIKKASSLFTDAVHGFFDEFQPEFGGTYLPKEVEKFMSVHTSIARGKAESRRYYPIYLSSNTVTVTNPYFIALGLTTKIQDDTKKFRGDGYVYQRTENKALAAHHDSTPMSRAFSKMKGSSFSDNSFINDSKSAVGKPTPDWGPGTYMATLDNDGKRYGLTSYFESGIIYLSHTPDPTHKTILRMKVDGEANLPVLKYTGVGRLVKDALADGRLWSQTLTCKSVAFEFMV